MSNDNDVYDARFAGVALDPKFKKPPRQERKVRIDKRFQSMFKNDAFRVKYSVDKRGRQISKSTSEDFKRFYDLSSDEESVSGVSEDEESNHEQTLEVEKSSDDNDGDIPTLAEDELIKKKQITSSVRKKLKDMSVDYARGEGKLFSESSSDELESEESETENVYHEWNELDKDADTTHKITNRLAVCNMDWDRIRAVDLMVLFNSFLPLKGFVRSVVIYPSEFGLKRLAEEEINGPAELVNGNPSDTSGSDSDEEGEEGKHYHMERMRQYQLNRLKYYYAVVTFDTPETADYIYVNCNGVEYERSGIRLDLRFIDDDTTFEEKPKDVCDSYENCQKYKPRFFTNTALQQVKVDLTWDETDPKRLEFTQKITESAKTDDIRDSDLEDFVALTSSGEEGNEKNGAFEDSTSENNSDGESDISDEKTDPIIKYRNLLKEIEENEKNEKGNDEELEITWGADSGKQSTKIKISQDITASEDEENSFQYLTQRRKENSNKKSRTKVKNQNEESSNNEDTVDDENTSDDYETTKLNSNEDSEVEDEQDVKSNFLSGKNRKPSKKTNIPKNSVLNEEDEETPFQRLIRKKKEKSKMKKMHKQKKQTEELSENEDMINNENKHGFKKKMKKSKRHISESEEEHEADVNDDRFSALYTSHLFNIDPTNPNFRKSKGMNAFVMEKHKRLSEKMIKPTDESDEPNSKKRKDSELSFLVKSLKNKATTMLKNKHKKPR